MRTRAIAAALIAFGGAAACGLLNGVGDLRIGDDGSTPFPGRADGDAGAVVDGANTSEADAPDAVMLDGGNDVDAGDANEDACTATTCCIPLGATCAVPGGPGCCGTLGCGITLKCQVCTPKGATCMAGGTDCCTQDCTNGTCH